MKIHTDTFGNKDKIKVGDLVYWTDLKKKRLILPKTLDCESSNSNCLDYRMSGVVSEVFCEQIGGRNVAFASVFCFRNEQKYEIPLISLKTIEKNKTIYKQEGDDSEICYN